MLSILRSDSGLVSQVLKGRTTQFDELVKRHFTMVYGVAFSYTRNHADAEDLSQEVFIRHIKNSIHFRTEENSAIGLA